MTKDQPLTLALSPPRGERGQFILIVTILGFAAIAYGAWIPAKAALAQVLLRAAWSRALHGAADARPWPWADTHAIARMVIERTGSDFVVLEGANGRALAFAPAHLEHTAMPGDTGNCVISAHRDTHFAALRELAKGDVIRVQRSDGQWFTYRTEESRVVDQHETWVTQSDGAASLTLITCYPFDAIVPGGAQRFVIWARGALASSQPDRWLPASPRSHAAWKAAVRQAKKPATPRSRIFRNAAPASAARAG